jgi:indolepyruvate ferredoxin oxidoreductase alpha subunit
VLLRPTTRVCHGCASVEVSEQKPEHRPEGFIRDTQRWVIFPRTAYLAHVSIEKRNPLLGDELSYSPYNKLIKGCKKGIATGGISYAYVSEALEGIKNDAAILKVGTPHPFPEKLALDFLDGLDEVLVIEELDPVIERELIYLCGKHHLNVNINGKLNGSVQPAGENTVEAVKQVLGKFLCISYPQISKPQPAPTLPVRPPVLCAGCPHRASFYAVKQAVKGKKAVFCGDIGCYTLGNALPLDMVDTCLCMGADVTIAQGIRRVEPDTLNFAFIGDSTFFASGISGVVNAVYNSTELILIVLDNSTTAMTGHQPHPGTGVKMIPEPGRKISIEKVLEAIGVSYLKVIDPFDLKAAVGAVKETAELKGVRAIIFRSPCIAIIKPAPAFGVSDKCIKCRKCINDLGCPAIVPEGDRVKIEASLCYGCAVCAQVCPVKAITHKKED